MYIHILNDRTSENLDMFPQKDYALHSKSFWVINQNDSQIRLKDFLITRIFENYKKI